LGRGGLSKITAQFSQTSLRLVSSALLFVYAGTFSSRTFYASREKNQISNRVSSYFAFGLLPSAIAQKIAPWKKIRHHAAGDAPESTRRAPQPTRRPAVPEVVRESTRPAPRRISRLVGLEVGQESILPARRPTRPPVARGAALKRSSGSPRPSLRRSSPDSATGMVLQSLNRTAEIARTTTQSRVAMGTTSHNTPSTWRWRWR
jgi:hypothetical protein